jgi:UDP-glucose 4-epimerase
LKVLVTGGAGYIGSVTAQALIDAGHQVVILDDLTTGYRELVPAGAQLFEGSVGDRTAVQRALGDGGVDACVHFAARIEAGESMRAPEVFFENNTSQTLSLLRTLMEAGVERFVFSSTAAVYGDPVRVPIDENDATDPTNTYGETKLLVERALGWLQRLRGLRYASLRYFNASGATPDRGEMHDPESHLIPLVLRVPQGLADEAVIFGDDYPTPDGTCIRDYIHVADLADAHVRAVDALAEHEKIICNLGNGRGFSVKEVIESCRRATGHPIPTRVAERRPGDSPQLVASSIRAREILGWEPSHPHLDDIVASAWAWHNRTRA